MAVTETPLQPSRSSRKYLKYMDKFWSVFTFPLGLLLCFGPAIVAWLIEEFKAPPPEHKDERK